MLGADAPADDLDDDEIERSIAEINEAIKKVGRADEHATAGSADADAAARPSHFHPRLHQHAEGSVLIEFGDTRVLCTASVEEKVPPLPRAGARAG